MKNTWLALRQDFSSSLGFQIGVTAKSLIQTSISGFRDYVWPLRTKLPVYHMKCEYQLENFLKRYRFQTDKFTDEELDEKQIVSQLDNLKRLSKPLNVTFLLFNVLKKARIIIKEILGEYDEEEHLSLCRFGKRASVGSPLRKSYLDLKLKAPFEASPEQIKWFKSYLARDIHLSRVVQKARPKGKPLFKICRSLTLTCVPKSWKSLRGITPNTTIGTFYTYGLGRVFTNRLRKVGLDIRKLQMKHGLWAKEFSISRTHVTADLSAASDSIVLQLLMYLIPRKWLRVLKLGLIRNITLPDGSTHQTPTFCGMGIGFTFPLETMVFYALLQAIKELSLTKGFVSVYGDDLIYPRAMHKYVIAIFPKLGFNLNEEKTYANQNFRESCGSDYYRGHDVRPVSPDAECRSNHYLPLQAFIYNLVNSLSRKWTPEEIPITLHYLKRELLGLTGEIALVPPSFPDGSGWKSSSPAVPKMSIKVPGYKEILLSSKAFYTCNKEWWSNYREPKYFVKKGNHIVQTWVFTYLEKVGPDRTVPNVYPYYWDALRMSNKILSSEFESELIESTTYETVHNIWKHVIARRDLEDFVKDIVDGRWSDPSDSTNLRWTAVKHTSDTYRSVITGKRLRKLEPVVALKDKGKMITRKLTGTVGEWC